MPSFSAVCSWEGDVVATALRHRKVLVLSGGPYIRNLLTLVERLDGRNGMNGDSLLTTIHRQQFDAVVLELQWPDLMSEEEVGGLGAVQTSWEGNLLLITAEINGPKTLDTLEQYLVNGLPQALPSLISRQ
jgi:hypothetical protein